jgi:hypothetical protein
MIIYWRVSEAQFTQSFTSRWENKNKRELLRKCWLSIQPGISDNDTVIILWDKVRETTLDWLKSNCNTKNIIVKECPIYTLDQAVVKQLGDVMDKRRHHYSSLAETINYYTQLHQEEIHYLCNDDFLHLPQALDAMRSVYRDGWQGFVVAYDYPDRYFLDRTRQCELLLNEYSHWRTIPSCTGCTSALGKTWQSHIKLFKQNAIYNSDSFTWEMYAKSGALCPVPGMATHLTNNCMTPRINWNAVYDSIDIGDSKWD